MASFTLEGFDVVPIGISVHPVTYQTKYVRADRGKFAGRHSAFPYVYSIDVQ